MSWKTNQKGNLKDFFDHGALSCKYPPGIHLAPTRDWAGLAGLVEGVAGWVGWMENAIWELAMIIIWAGRATGCAANPVLNKN